jgi:hypothetical protein
LTGLTAIAALIASTPLVEMIFVAQVHGKPAVAKEVRPAEDATQIRVRELIYILRQHRVFERRDEWGGAIQQLAKIGPPALPELLLELKQTERGTTLRGVLFALRAIDDARAVPFVIESLPKAERLSRSGSDCAVDFTDPKLQRFMRQNQNYPRDEDEYVSYGRPINEILGTLHKLSRTTPPDLTKGLEPSWTAKYWREWWKAKQAAGNAPKKDEALQLPLRKEDLVERDGVRKFGPLFPTGAGQNLSPMTEVSLASNIIPDAPSALDFETGRLYEHLEGLRVEANAKEEEWSTLFDKWYSTNGIDLEAHAGRDLHLWLINNERWDSLDAEVQSSKPFNIGTEAPSYWMFGNNPRPGQVVTYLFTTREGTRGVLRIYRPPSGEPTRFEYRLWNRDNVALDNPRLPESNAATDWQPPKIVMLKEPDFGNRCLFNLEKGESDVLPASIFAPNSPPKINELLNTFGTILKNDRIAKWARSRGVDVASHRSLVISEGGDRPRQELGQLTIIDARAVPVSREAFESLTLAHAKEILARYPDQFAIAYLSAQSEREAPPATFLVTTKSGTTALIKILNVREKLSSISFQYKLANSKEGVNTN